MDQCVKREKVVISIDSIDFFIDIFFYNVFSVIVYLTKKDIYSTQSMTK